MRRRTVQVALWFAMMDSYASQITERSHRHRRDERHGQVRNPKAIPPSAAENDQSGNCGSIWSNVFGLWRGH